MIETMESVRDTLQRVLAAEMDPYLESSGFIRSDKSLEYVRVCEAGEQSLEMTFDFKPVIEPRAIARIHPWIRLNFWAVNRIAWSMVGFDPSLLGDPNITLRQPIDIVVPKDCHVRWFVYDREGDVVLCVRSIKGYLKQWIIPFLKEYSTVASLARYYDTGDDRVLKSKQFYVYVTAAHVLLGDSAKAMQILDSQFGKSGARKQYAKMFEFVAKTAHK